MNAIHLNFKGHESQLNASVNKGPAAAPKRYSATAIALHWVLGLVIVAVFGVGLYMANLPFSPLRLKLYNWHKWTGMTLLALSVFRLVWRITHRPPTLPANIANAMPTWQHHNGGRRRSSQVQARADRRGQVVSSLVFPFSSTSL